MQAVLESQGCQHQVPQAGDLKQEKCPHTVLEAGSPCVNRIVLLGPRVEPFLPSFSFFFFFLHLEAPRLGVESELQLQVYTTATAMQVPSQVCDLHHNSQQRRILNLLREARD